MSGLSHPGTRRFAFAGGFLLVSLAVFAASLSWTVQTQVLGTGDAVRRLLETEAAGHREALKHAQARERQRSTRPNIASVPDFIATISEIAGDVGVSLSKMHPEAEPASAFAVEFIGSFTQFERFVARLELLDVRIVDLSLKRHDDQASPPLHAIAITLVPQNDAVRLEVPRLQAILEELRTGEHRNPFQRLSNGTADKGEPARIDLSLNLHLTGIGTINEQRIATIGGYDYRVGDSVEGRTITRIGEGVVLLERDGGDRLERFILQFRLDGGNNNGPRLLPNSVEKPVAPISRNLTGGRQNTFENSLVAPAAGLRNEALENNARSGQVPSGRER